MILYTISSDNFQNFFGNLENPIVRDGIVFIGQRPDCSEFLLLSNTSYSELTEHITIPEGFDFTFRQEWGLIINEEIVRRVIDTLRAEAYPPISDYMDGLVKNNTEQINDYLAKCLAVKQKYPKGPF